MFSSTGFNRFSALGALVTALFINRAVLSNAHPMNPAGSSNATAGQSSVELDDQMYNTEPTDYCRRDAGFDTRKIVGGFEGKPAVVKQPKPTGGLTDELILKEIDFLNRFNLLLIENEEGEEKDDDGSYPIVSRDVREEYPKKDSPSMKHFHEWYLADPTMDAQDALERFWESQKNALRTIATDFDLLHFNINLRSSFTTKDFSTIVPNSWVANRPGFPGVKDAADSSELDGSDPGFDESDSDEGYKSEPSSSEDENGANDVIQNYIDHLEDLEEETGLPVAFRVGALREVLAGIGEELHN